MKDARTVCNNVGPQLSNCARCWCGHVDVPVGDGDGSGLLHHVRLCVFTVLFFLEGTAGFAFLEEFVGLNFAFLEETIVAEAVGFKFLATACGTE